MTQTIARIYESSQQASDAAADLRAAGFTDDSIHLLPHPGRERPSATAAMTEALTLKGVQQSQAIAYAEEVVQGGAILTVYPPFGMAIKAEYIMNAYNPVGPAGYDAVTPPMVSPLTSQAPLSAALHLPLIVNDPAPLSGMLAMSILLDTNRFFTDRWAKLLSTKPYTFASSAVLSDKIAPLSERLSWRLLSTKQYMFDWPMLTENKFFMHPPSLIEGTRHFTARWGMLRQHPIILKNWALLSDKIAPLSDFMGWKLLTAKQSIFSSWPQLIDAPTSFPSLISGSFKLTERLGLLIHKRPSVPLLNDAAPLSSKFGWSVLSGSATPLSAKFSWPVLSGKQITLANWPSLSGGATPLSNMFSLPVLTKQRPAKS